MTVYTGSALFSGTQQIYRLDVTVTTVQESGGTRINFTSDAVMVSHPSGVTPAFSSNGLREYSVPKGRSNSFTGSYLTSGDAAWSYDFSAGEGTEQLVWGSVNRYVTYADSATLGYQLTVTIEATGSGSSYLGYAKVEIPVTLFTNSYNYEIDYIGNGGSGDTTSTIATSTSSSYTLTVANSGFTRTGYIFSGWNTSSGGGGTSYSPGQSVSLTSGSPTLTLYAQWTAQYTVSLNANGGSVSPSSYTVNPGNYVSLASPSWSGKTFVGWFTASSGGSQVSSYYLPTSSITLYAQWQYTLSWNGNGGTVSGGATGVQIGNSIILPSASRSGYVLRGWYTASSGGTNIGTAGQSYTPIANDTFYAQWNALDVVWTDATLTLTAKKNQSYTGDTSVSASYVNSWSVSGVPSGLTFNQSTSTVGSSTSTLTGTPTVYGNYTITLTPINADGVSGQSYQYLLQINDITPTWSDQVILNNVVIQGDLGYSDQVSVVAGPTVTYSVASGYTLPAGLLLNETTGALTAHPTTGITAVPDIYTFRVTATNATGQSITTSDLVLTVEAAGGYVKVWNGTTWVEGTAQVYNGTNWIDGTVQVRNGDGWTDSFST